MISSSCWFCISGTPFSSGVRYTAKNGSQLHFRNGSSVLPLLEGLKEAAKPCKTVKGCALFILGEQSKSKPRFARWNAKLIGTFINPLDEGEQCLITPIAIHQLNPDWIGKNMARDRDIDENPELSPERDAPCPSYRTSDAFSTFNRLLLPLCPRREKQVWKNFAHLKEHLPSSEPMMPAIPNLPTKESRAKQNEHDVLYTSVKDLHGIGVHMGV
ncbi:hypothetical protein MKW94_008655 [Papaver nudicaule]|uniref:Uncharacterized protein n=1 Tax=Papaver nudicaule TaxID=74823 RepID=A0AA41V9X7_PAPNU|nr:hypothetical protein [Papaver nudicaule]